MFDISGIIKGTGVSLEKEAFGQFGAAVNNQVGGILGPMLGLNKPKPGQADGKGDLNATAAAAGSKPGVWDPTPYASNIGSFKGQYDPKSKFLFKVSFQFHPDVLSNAAQVGFKQDDLEKLTKELNFVVKQIDLPKVEFEYEEVNMYNFRTKVLKSIKNRELNLTFYDDTGNRAMDFMNLYMMLLKPVTRKEYSPTFALNDHGFAFQTSAVATDTAFRGVLPGNAKNVLSTVIIEQFYMRLGEGLQLTENNIRLNRFILINPRLQSFDIGDHDHEAGGIASTIAAAFDFDALHIDTNQSGKSTKIATNKLGDLMGSIDEAPSFNAGKGQTSAGGEARNPFVDIIARQGQRLIQNAVGNVLTKAFGNSIAGQALNSVTSSISGMLGEAGANTLRNAGNGVIQGLARPSPPPLVDNSASSTLSQRLTTKTTGD
jgi:hypothetical protein